MSIKLPILDLRGYQKPAWNYFLQDKKGLRGVMVWPRRNGKDLTSINILVAKALQRKGLYLYIAPFANQVRSIVWDGSDGQGKRFLDYIPSEIVTRKLDQQMKLWLTNGSIIHLVGSDNPDAIVGTNPMGIIFTEFSLHKPGIWQYMRPVLAENGGWALFNGTPRGMNHFHDMAKVAKKNHSWFYEHLTAENTHFPTAEEIDEERQAGMPESLIQQEFYTSWTASSEETLIPLDKIMISQDQLLTPDQYSYSHRVIGVDPAYAEKGDRAAIARRQGRHVLPFIKDETVFQGIDPMALATRISALILSWRPHAVFVDAGRGEAVWSRLFQLGHEDVTIPVHFDGTTYDPLCHRKKDEIWNRMKNAICHPDRPICLPEDEELARDLSAPTFEINERGLLQIESKKSLRSRGFRSTDLGDALALTFSEEEDLTPILTPEMEALGITEDILGQLAGHTQNEEYDPLGYMDSLVMPS